MIRLDIGCGKSKQEGFIGMDIARLENVDVLGSMNNIPLKNSSVDEVFMHFILEHSDNVLLTMKELHRVCKNGGIVLLSVPYYNSPDSFRDPTHKAFFTERSMEYFTEGKDFGYYTNVRFEIEKVEYGTTAIGKVLPIEWRIKLAHYIGNVITGITWTLRAKK